MTERKAGRFAFHNLPPSAVTSPVLSATEGPKLPRKFTIVESQNTISSISSGILFDNVLLGDKKSRFQVIDLQDHPSFSSAISCLNLSPPSSAAFSDQGELISALLKQNDGMRVVIAELVGVMQRGNGSGIAHRVSSVTDSDGERNGLL